MMIEKALEDGTHLGVIQWQTIFWTLKDPGTAGGKDNETKQSGEKLSMCFELRGSVYPATLEDDLFELNVWWDGMGSDRE